LYDRVAFLVKYGINIEAGAIDKDYLEEIKMILLNNLIIPI
jgi:dUTPase